MESMTVRVPGKLLLAGEYAVLEPGGLALVLAVNRYLHVQLGPAPSYSLSSDLSSEPWGYQPDKIMDAPVPLRFAAAALALGWQSLSESLSARPPFKLQISSHLHTDGHKYGLGSSAAVVVGTLASLFAFTGHDIASDDVRQQLFRLAILAHRSVQGNGSGADLAGCIHGSVTAYTSPDFDRVPFQLPLAKLQTMDWPLLGLHKLDWPKTWPPLQFGWTGAAADTHERILDYQDWKKDQPESHAEFLFESSLASLGLREALQQADLNAFVQGLGRARRLLQRLENEIYANSLNPLPLETPALAALADAAEALGGAGKLSGAGGGDCGLAWVPEDFAEALQQAWRQAGILPLALALDQRGVHRL